MKSWRSKFIFVLIVYFGGFATAIYMMGPAPENAADGSVDAGKIREAVKTDEFAKSLNEGMHKAVAVSKDFAVRAGKYIKTKIEEIESQREG